VSLFLRLTVVVSIPIMCAASPQAPSSQTRLQADGQPDPQVVADNVRAIRSALREIDARVQQALNRDALKPGLATVDIVDAGALKKELESFSKTLKTLNQRLSRVLTLEALESPSAGARTLGRRDLRPVMTEMEIIAKEFETSCTRVNKIEAITVKQKSSAAAQTLASDLEFIKKSANKAQDGMKRVLFGAAGPTGGLD